MNSNLLTSERIAKIVAGKPGDRGVPVEKYVEPDWESGRDIDTYGAYEELLRHHEKETRILYEYLQEACAKLEQQQPVIDAAFEFEHAYTSDSNYWDCAQKLFLNEVRQLRVDAI